MIQVDRIPMLYVGEGGELLFSMSMHFLKVLKVRKLK